MRPFFLILFLLLGFNSLAIAHDNGTHEHGLIIDMAWAPHTGKRTMSAAVYMTIKNEGQEDDSLIGVRTSAADMAMIHESKEVDNIMRMEHVEALPVVAGTSAALKPGGHHIMLMQLAEPLRRGEVFPLTLVFAKAGDVDILVEITGIGGPQ